MSGIGVVDSCLHLDARAGALLLSTAPLAKAQSSIYDVVNATADLSTLKAAIDTAGLAETLSNASLAYTVFAPSNPVGSLTPFTLVCMYGFTVLVPFQSPAHSRSGNRAGPGNQGHGVSHPCRCTERSNQLRQRIGHDEGAFSFPYHSLVPPLVLLC